MMFQKDPYFRTKFPRKIPPPPEREPVGKACYCFDCGRSTSKAVWLVLPSTDKIKMCTGCIKAYDERGHY